MFHQQVANLVDEPFQKVKQWFDTFDSIICDVDGVLWNEEHVFDGSKDVINYLQNEGKKVYFCTNNISLEIYELAQIMRNNGFKVDEQQILSTGHSTAMLLKSKNFRKQAYVIGKLGIVHELQKLGVACVGIGPDILEHKLPSYMKRNLWHSNHNIGAVIVGLDEHFSYTKLLKAKTYLQNPNCLFLGMNNEKGCLRNNNILPGSSALIRAVEVASNRSAQIVGKPHRLFLEYLFKDGSINAARTLIIGDSCRNDILLGFNCACQTLLVGSGIDTYEIAMGYKDSADEQLNKLTPDVYLPSLGDLLECLDVHVKHSFVSKRAGSYNKLAVLDDWNA